MKLSVKERLAVPQILPEESNLYTQMIARNVRNKAEFSPEETAEIGLQAVGGSLSWSNDKSEDVSFTEEELQLLKDQVEKLDKENKITNDLLDLCLKVKNKEVNNSKKTSK